MSGKAYVIKDGSKLDPTSAKRFSIQSSSNKNLMMTSVPSINSYMSSRQDASRKPSEVANFRLDSRQSKNSRGEHRFLSQDKAKTKIVEAVEQSFFKTEPEDTVQSRRKSRIKPSVVQKFANIALQCERVRATITKLSDDDQEEESQVEQQRLIQNLVHEPGFPRGVKEMIVKDEAFFKSIDQKRQPKAKDFDTQELKKYRYLLDNSHYSPESYFKCYKSLERVEEINNLYKIKPNLYVEMARVGSQHCTPRQMGIFQQNFVQKSINSTNRIPKNKHYVEKLMRGVQSLDHVTHLDLKNNQLMNTDIKKIVDQLKTPIRYFDISHNLVGVQGVRCLIPALRPPFQIQHLNLEQNKLGDAGVNLLLSNLETNRTLMSLNLSCNQLTFKCANQLGQYVRRSTSLCELYLSFNSINGPNSIIFWKSLERNQSLRVLDMSHNSLGGKGVFKKICKVIVRPHQYLNHLDLSFNHFDEGESTSMAISLAKNQILYGFHFQGNDPNFYVDVKGYLVSKTNDNIYVKPHKKRVYKMTEIQVAHESNEHQMDFKEIEQKIDEYKQRNTQMESFKIYRKIDGLRALPAAVTSKEEEMYQNINSCWICDGFQEKELTYTPHVSGNYTESPIYVHLNFLQYKPILLQKHPLRDEFVTKVMCPANKQILYFFSNPITRTQVTAKDQRIIETPLEEVIRRERIDIAYMGSKHTTDANENNQKEYLIPFITVKCQKMTHLNSLQTDPIQTGTWDSKTGRYVINDHKHFKPMIECKPREEFANFDMSNLLVKRQKPLWTVENSIFNKYQEDTAVLINDCFEFDLQCSKISKIIKDPMEFYLVKEQLRIYYPQIFKIYKYYASYFVNSAIPCLSMNSISDLVSKTNIVDGKRLKAQDIDVLFVSTNTKDLNFPYVVEKCLVRFQILELLVRIAQDKYMRNTLARDKKDDKNQVPIQESVRRIFEDDELIKWTQQFDTAQEWRDQRFWNQECEKVLLAKHMQVKALFEFGCDINPKKAFYRFKFMTPRDLQALVQQIANDSISDKDIYLAFLLSMMTQVDEVNHQRHIQMTLLEFYEALARVAEKLSTTPNLFEYDYMTVNEKRQLPLHVKLDALINQLFDSLKNRIQEWRASKGLEAVRIQDEDEQSVSSGKSQDSESELTESEGPSPDRFTTVVQKQRPLVREIVIEENIQSYSPKKGIQLTGTIDIPEDVLRAPDIPLSSRNKKNMMKSSAIQPQVARALIIQQKEKLEDQFTLVTVLKYLNKNRVLPQ